MSVKVIHKCDRCSEEWVIDVPENKEKQIWTVAIGISNGPQATFSSYDLKTVQWCRKCVIETGLLSIKPADKTVPDPISTPSFEDKVIELLASLGFEQTS